MQRTPNDLEQDDVTSTEQVDRRGADDSSGRGEMADVLVNQDLPSLRIAASPSEKSARQPGSAARDVHRLSAGELLGYHTYGPDGAIIQVEEFVVDNQTWEVSYLIVAAPRITRT